MYTQTHEPYGTATGDLVNDHVLVLRITRLLEAMVDANTTSVDDLKTVVNLVRHFADGFHHAKEEQLLFPKLQEKGFSNEQGPVAVMLAEHVIGRNHISAVEEGIQVLESGATEAPAALYEHLLEYAFLLQHHIEKENDILFRMADRALTANEQAALYEAFEQVIAHYDATYLPETVEVRLQQLESIYIHA